MEGLSVPLGSAHRVVLDTIIFRIDTVRKVNMKSFHWNTLQEFH